MIELHLLLAPLVCGISRKKEKIVSIPVLAIRLLSRFVGARFPCLIDDMSFETKLLEHLPKTAIKQAFSSSIARERVDRYVVKSYSKDTGFNCQGPQLEDWREVSL